MKSNFEPWRFKNATAVEWFIRHPTPLFLCVVTKRAARFRVYQTTVKYYFWTTPPYPKKLCLLAEEHGERGQFKGWHDATATSLGAPIVDVTLGDLANRTTFEGIGHVLRSWLELEYENLFRLASRLPMFVAPCEYLTNNPIAVNGKPVGGRSILWLNVPNDKAVEDALSSAKDVISWAMAILARRKDWPRAIRAALFFQSCWPKEIEGNLITVCHHLDEVTGNQTPRYVAETLDTLSLKLDDLFNQMSHLNSDSDLAATINAGQKRVAKRGRQGGGS